MSLYTTPFTKESCNAVVSPNNFSTRAYSLSKLKHIHLFEYSMSGAPDTISLFSLYQRGTQCCRQVGVGARTAFMFAGALGHKGLGTLKMNKNALGYFLGFSKFPWGPPKCRNFGGFGHPSVSNGKLSTGVGVTSWQKQLANLASYRYI